MTTFTVWVLFLYFDYRGYHEHAISVATIDNIATQQECETKLKEALDRWKIVVSGMCMSVQKAK